jgi:predicted nucleotidyltransferase component of viral defense system
MVKVNLTAYAEQLARINGRQFLLPVIERELLHYEIIAALEKAGLLSGLVFQGGTCLRLCYGAIRFSEDLDFVGGSDFDATDLEELKSCLEEFLEKKYSVQVHIQKPKETDNLIKKWIIRINTAPARPDIPLQRITLEVASIPAYTKQPRSLQLNYEGLNQSYQDIILYAESREEIFADKLESFICSPHIRHRDIWDLHWLARQPRLDVAKAHELRKLKESDYQETGKFQIGLMRVQTQLKTIVESPDFIQQMKRFLPNDIFEETLKRPLFREVLVSDIQDLYAPYL